MDGAYPCAILWQATSDEEEWRQKQARAQAEYGPRKEKFDEAKEKVLRLKKEGEEKQEEASAFEGPQRRLTSDQRKAAKELEKAQGDGEAKRADAQDPGLSRQVRAAGRGAVRRARRRPGSAQRRARSRVRRQFQSRGLPSRATEGGRVADFETLGKRLQKAEKKHGGQSLQELEARMVETARKLRVKKEELQIVDTTCTETKAFSRRGTSTSASR